MPAQARSRSSGSTPTNSPKTISTSAAKLTACRSGRFGPRGIDGKILAIKYARTRSLWDFVSACNLRSLICPQCCRPAATRQFEPDTFIMSLTVFPNYQGINFGGTMRLGLYNCKIGKGTLAYQAYEKEEIGERHRHRYEFNNKFKKILDKHGVFDQSRNKTSRDYRNQGSSLVCRLSVSRRVSLRPDKPTRCYRFCAISIEDEAFPITHRTFHCYLTTFVYTKNTNDFIQWCYNKIQGD